MRLLSTLFKYERFGVERMNNVRLFNRVRFGMRLESRNNEWKYCHLVGRQFVGDMDEVG